MMRAFRSSPTCRRLSLRFIAEFLLLRAPRAVSFLTDPDDQISLVQALDPWLRHRRIMRRDIWLLMTQRGLRQRLDSYLKFSHQTLRLRFFDFYSLAARQLLHKHQLDQWADILGQGQIHLAIYGFGRLGRAIAKEAARYYVTRASIAGPHRKLRLTIIDAAPEEALAAFLAEEPEIEKVLEIAPIRLRLQPPIPSLTRIPRCSSHSWNMRDTWPSACRRDGATQRPGATRSACITFCATGRISVWRSRRSTRS
jgi:hypothetical protein